MPEAYTWPEGQIAFHTGSATASAVVAFAQNMQAMMIRGWSNDPSLAGVYRDHLTGQRADVVLGAVYTHDATLLRMEASATAMHMKLLHSGIHGSAGFQFYSGRIDAISIIGSEGQPYVYQVSYHANVWSAFGGQV